MPSPEYIAARDKAIAAKSTHPDAFKGHDDLDPKAASGHAYGIRTSTRLTSDYREARKKHAMDVKPQEVIDCLVAAGVKGWVLMGLHGYIGYLPMPRATQDVDVLVPYSQKKRTVRAISDRWPELEQRELSQVIRFLDPSDLDREGNPMPVIDVMLPWASFQERILKHHVCVDPDTGNRVPVIEAAVVSKYAAMISPHRSLDKKEFDAGDLRRLIKTNHDSIDMNLLSELAAEVWEGGSDEIQRFLQQALDDEPFS